MNIINRSTFKELAEVQQPHCVSIYVPTHRAGGPEGIKQDKLNYKNQLKEAGHKLEAFALSKDRISEYLQPATALLEDENLWSHLSDGLIVFLYGDTMKYFLVPLEFEPRHHIGSSLYLLPAIPLLTDSGRHFIMALSLNKVRFFEATRHSVTPVEVSDLVPDGLVEAVGADYEQESLQFHSGLGKASDAAIYHGQGAGEMPEKKEEIARYFSDVDRGIMKMLHDESAPLVLACVDYLYPIYKECNTYNHLASEFIQGNHDQTGPVVLQEHSWKIVGKQFDKDRGAEIERFNEKLSAAMASLNETEVIPAGIIGQADTLFVRKGSQIWGRYDPSENKVEIDQVDRTGNTELVNKAAVETVRHGGKVLYLTEDDIPEEMGDVAATYRYSM